MYNGLNQLNEYISSFIKFQNTRQAIQMKNI